MSKFQAGDIVRVREWDDMAAQFGADPRGDYIKTPSCGFVLPMKIYCGKIFTIKKVIIRADGIETYIFDEKVSDRNFTGKTSDWNFTGNMLELACAPYNDREMTAASRQQLNKFYGR